MENTSLTSFGLALKEASEHLISKKSNSFNISNDLVLENRRIGQNIFSKINSLINEKPKVVLIAPGPLSRDSKQLINYLQKEKEYLICGVQFTNFHHELELDIQLSTHALTLMASLESFNKPKHIIHGVYDKTPPVLQNSCTVCWSDPFMTKRLFKNGIVTGKRIIEINNKSLFGEVPYISVPRNVMMFASFSLLFLGAKKIILAGFDPITPTYFFSEDDSLKLEIIRSLSLADPMIAGWDGRNERIPPPLDTLFRQSSFIKDIAHARPVSGVASGWRFEELIRGTNLLKLLIQKLDKEINYIGTSIFCNKLAIKKMPD